MKELPCVHVNNVNRFDAIYHYNLNQCNVLCGVIVLPNSKDTYVLYKKIQKGESVSQFGFNHLCSEYFISPLIY